MHLRMYVYHINVYCMYVHMHIIYSDAIHYAMYGHPPHLTRHTPLTLAALGHGPPALGPPAPGSRLRASAPASRPPIYIYIYKYI